MSSVDLTQDHIYTLSPGTRQILRRPEGADHAAAVLLAPARQHRAGLRHLCRPRARDAARNTPRVSDGKIKLEFYDPEPFSDTEDRAMAYGLQGVPVDQAGKQVYFGLAGTNLLDDERTIPFFQPERERFLEYDLTKLVYELSNPKRPVVGVMSSLPLDGDPRMMMMTHGHAARRPALCVSTELLRQTNTVKTVADRRAGDRPRHPGAAGGRGAEPLGRHAVCHRPVRHARRPADGDGRSVERGDGGAAEPRPACRRRTRIPT